MRTGMLQWLVATATFAACTSEDSNHTQPSTWTLQAACSPFSYQRRPSSPPPLACAMANEKPLSSKLIRMEEKYGSLQIS